MTHIAYTIFIEIPRNHIDHDITFLNTTTTSTCHLLKLTNLFMHWRITIEVIYNWIILYYFRDLKQSAKTNVQTPLISDNFFKRIILPVMQENLKFEVSLIEKKKNSDSTLLYVPNVLLVLSFDMLQHCHN